jgi:hypothetical protein
MGLTTRFLLLSDICGFVNVGRCLWREGVSYVYNCCWLSTGQSFSGPSPVGLATVFYCLRFDISLFVASYDSQGHGGGIRPRHHTGFNNSSQSHIATDGQSVSQSCYRAPIWGSWPDIYYCLTITVLLLWGALNCTASPHYIASAPTAQKILFHYCAFFRCRGNNMSTWPFPSKDCYTVACLHSCCQWVYMSQYITEFLLLRTA